jgi:hypothetical protein
MSFDETSSYISDNFDSTGTRVFTIGFNGGDSAVLENLALSGRGKYYNAQDPEELDNVYNDISQILFYNLAARNLLIQEGLAPNLTLIPGSPTALSATSVPLLGSETTVDAQGQTLLTWSFDHLPIFSNIELYYEVAVDNSSPYYIGLDSNHSLNDNYSLAQFLDINLDSTTLFLPVDSVIPEDRPLICTDINCDNEVLDSLADEIGIPVDSLTDSVEVPDIPPDTVVIGPGDTIIVNPGDTVVVVPDTMVIGPGDTIIVNLGDTIIIGPGDTVIVSPGDTIIAGPSDTIVVIPGDTLITDSGDTIVVNPGDTLVVGPQDTVEVIPGPIVIIGPDQPDDTTSRITVLDLSGLDLDSVPALVGMISGLEELDLSNNNIVVLPPFIADLENLISLDLSENKIVDFPMEVDNLDLITLDLSNNLIEEFPSGVNDLSVVNLDLSHNQISSLPDNIGNLNVKNLDLSNNNFTEFPYELEFISGLEYVDLSNNNIESLPDILPPLGIAVVNINNNRLCSLSVEQEAWLNDIASDLNWKETQDCPVGLVKSAWKKGTRIYFRARKLHIDFHGYPGVKKIYVFNIKGERLFHSSGTENSYVWDVNSTPRGIYFLQLFAEDLRKTSRIIIP